MDCNRYIGYDAMCHTDCYEASGSELLNTRSLFRETGAHRNNIPSAHNKLHRRKRRVFIPLFAEPQRKRHRSARRKTPSYGSSGETTGSPEFKRSNTIPEVGITCVKCIREGHKAQECGSNTLQRIPETWSKSLKRTGIMTL